MMFLANRLRGVGGRRARLVYVGPPSSSDSSLTTYTFSSVSLGAAAGRSGVVILAGQRGSNSRSIVSATVAGNAATLRTASAAASGGSSAAFTYEGSEETANITVTLSGSNGGCIIFVYAVYGASSMVPADADSTTNTSSVASVTLTGVNGCLLFAISAERSGDLLTASWTNVAEDDQLAYAGSDSASCASGKASADSVAVTATLSGTPSRHSLSSIALQ